MRIKAIKDINDLDINTPVRNSFGSNKFNINPFNNEKALFALEIGERAYVHYVSQVAHCNTYNSINHENLKWADSPTINEGGNSASLW